MIRAVDLVKYLGGIQVVRGVSLDVERSRITVIMGPNGSGKTTLLRMLGLLLPPDGGLLEMDGVNLLSLDEEGRRGFLRRVAFVPQKPVVLTANVYRNIAIPLRLRGLDPRTADAEAWRWLKEVNLEKHAWKSAHSLSGGERQLLALARALALSPDVLLLDEPTSHLDPKNAAFVQRLVKEYVSERGIHCVVVSHNVREAKFLADEILVMVSGRIKARYGPDAPESELLKWI